MGTLYNPESTGDWRQNLFELSDPLLNSAFTGTVGPEAYDVMRKAVRGEVVPADPIVVTHSMGGRLRDFIWISLEPVVHERVIETLLSVSITGWATYAVQVYERDGRAVPDYHGFAITGRCGFNVSRQRAFGGGLSGLPRREISELQGPLCGFLGRIRPVRGRGWKDGI
jgi:hypothetical protein